METALKTGGKFGGRFQVECLRPYDQAEASRIKREYGSQSPEYKALPRYPVWTEDVHNLVTNQGLDSILNVYLDAATQITTWYCVIFESNSTPDAGWTYATPTYTELQTYDEATRPEYKEAASSSQSVTNSANKAVFTISATKTLYGAALVGGGSAATTKADTAGGGTLLCAAKFASSRSVVDNDVCNLTYTFSAADDGA